MEKLKLLSVILVFLAPSLVMADRYGIYDDPEMYGSGGGIDPFAILSTIVFVMLAYWFLFSSFNEWSERRRKGEKIKRSEFTVDVLIPFVGYMVVAILLCLPLMMVLKLIGGAEIVRDVWLVLWITCFCVIVFLRHT